MQIQKKGIESGREKKFRGYETERENMMRDKIGRE